MSNTEEVSPEVEDAGKLTADELANPEANKKTLTKGDLALFWFLQNFFQKMAESLSYYYANGICASMIHCLKKLYADDEEGLQEALLRHLEVYISEGNVGSIILGAAMAMEEEKANGAPISGATITAFKTSTMGPIAGLGDTLMGYIIFPVTASMFVGFGMQGSYLCLLTTIVQTAIFFAISIALFRVGYYQGRMAVLKVLRGDWLDRLVVGAGILGMLMMGCLAANYVVIEPTLVLDMGGGNTLDIPGLVNSIVPGFTPFLFMVLGYFYLEKGKKASSMKLMLIYLAVIIVGVLVHLW